MLRLLRALLAEIERQTPSAGGLPVLSSGDYESQPLDPRHFHPVSPRFPAGQVGFLDAGNNEIVSTPAVAIGWVRIYWSVFKGERKLRHRLRNHLVVVRRAEGDPWLAAEVYPVEGGAPLRFRFPPPLPPGEPTRSPLAGGIGAVRRHLEWQATLELLQTLRPGDLAVRDGTLEAEGGTDDPAREALAVAEEREVLLVGLSKSCALLTASGLPLLSALALMEQERGVPSPWVYHPLGRPRRETLPHITVVRLHPSSAHLFRLDLPFWAGERAEEVAALLAAYARDPALLGYPYGLLDADRHARVPEKEVNLLRRVAEQEMGPATRLGYQALSADRLLKGG